MNNQQIDKITEPSAEAGQLSAAQVVAWLAEVEQAKAREKSWRTEAKKITALYEGYRREASPFNILYSNTDTLLPALYNNTPRPAVGRRYKDKDPLGAAVSLVLNRTLTYTMDTNDGDKPEFDQMAEHAILQALVPGRGVCRWKFEADIIPVPGVQGTVKQPVKDVPNTAAEGYSMQPIIAPDQEQPAPIPEVKNQRICGEMVPYDRVTYGYAKNWKQVPWVSFEHHMTAEELETNFGPVAKAVKTSEMEEDQQDENSECKDKRKVAVVYELWNKEDRTVMFITPGLKGRELKLVPDPLEISGFFPMDEPLHFMPKVSSMVPQPIYELYREQAQELNTITSRITAIMNCLKVRGAYDSSVTELSSILQLDDGQLKAIDGVAVLGEGKSLKDAIFLMPLTELVSVLQQLYLQRTQIKTVIYEITGISDIIRGSSVASETATAQTIKNQWGTLRLKKMQKAVQKWCRNNLRIVAQIAAKKFSKETFIRMTELPYVTAEQKQQAQMQMQQFQMQQQQQAQMQPPQPGQPPTQPPATQLPPQQLLDTLATPVWEEILGLMRDTVGMEFRVDIETNSTIADDMAEDQKNVGELLNALSQFLNGVAPLIENGSMPFEVAKTIMLGIVRKMQMGPEVEDQLEKMKAPEPPKEAEPPAPPPPDPNIQLKQQAEAAKIQGDMEKMRLEGELAKEEMAIRREEFQMKRVELQQKAQLAEQKFQQQMLMARQKAAQPQPQSTPAGE